jgi:HlyD family secretion protein
MSMNRTHALLRRPGAPVLAAIAILGAAALLIAPGSRAADAKKDAAPRPAMTVSTAQPQQASLPVRLAANGNIAAWQEAVVGSEASGLRLTEVLVNVGDTVKAGQTLATFAAETVEADVAQARASLAEAKANAADAHANAERARTLQATGALSAQQIAQYATTEQTARAKVEAARAVLKARKLRLTQTRVLAPDSGVISSRTATVGSVVGAGTELFKLVRRGRLEWRAEVTSSELARVRPGIAATVTAASGAQVQGKVRSIAPTVDPQTRNALVYVDLAPHPDVKAGMFARGEFGLGTTSAVTVPQEALVVRDGFTYVFQVGPDSRVAQRKVETARRVGGQVEILKGLDANATVAVRGAGFLNDGDLVRVANESAAAPAASARQ